MRNGERGTGNEEKGKTGTGIEERRTRKEKKEGQV